MKKFYLLFVVFIFIFSGCASKLEVSDSRIVVGDSSIDGWLKLVKVNHYKREDGLLMVQAKFKNLTSSNKKVVYKIDWLDKNGFTQKSILSKWVIVEIEANREFVIQAISPSIKVEDFEIRLDEPTENDTNRKDSYHQEYQN